MATSNLIPSFLFSYDKAIRRWVDILKKRAAKADYIVAISRKGPRLLELLHANGLIEQWILDKVVSELAVIYLPVSKEKKRFLIVDDSLVNGTTFINVCRMIKRFHRDAIVQGLPFAVSLQHDPQARPCVSDHALRLGEGDQERYMKSFVRSLASLAKGLLVSLPVFEMEIKGTKAADVRKRVEAFAAEIKSTASDITQTYYAYRGNDFATGSAAVSAMEEVSVPVWLVPLTVGGKTDKDAYNHFTALKFHFDKPNGTLRISPCCHQTFGLEHKGKEETPWEKSLENLPEPLWEIARQIVPTCYEGEEIGSVLQRAWKKEERSVYSLIDPAILEYLATLHNYLFAAQLFVQYLPPLKKHLSPVTKHGKEPVFTLNPYDVRLLVGPQCADLVVKAVDETLKTQPKTKLGKKSVFAFNADGSDCPTQFFSDRYAPGFIENLSKMKNRMFAPLRNETAPNGGGTINEDAIWKAALEAFLWRQHFDIEMLSRRQPRLAQSKRLRFGCNYEVLFELVALISTDEDLEEHADWESWKTKFLEYFEMNIDAACLVPAYFSHKTDYRPDVRKLIKKKEKRYNAVRYVSRFFRVGEGIPESVQYHYADKLIETVTRNSEISDKNGNNKRYYPLLELPSQPKLKIEGLQVFMATAKERLVLWGNIHCKRLAELMKKEPEINRQVVKKKPAKKKEYA